MNPLLLSALAGLSVFITITGISLALRRQETLAERLARYGVRPVAREAQPREEAGKKASPLTSGLNQAIARQSFAANIARELARADLKLTVSEYVLANLACVLLGFILGAIASRSLLFALGTAVVGFYLPGLYVKFRQRQRLNAFNARLSDTITMLANGLRSGYSLLQSMDMVAKESPPPVSEEFARVVREIGLGLSLDEALANLLRRVPSDDLDLMITAINIQHEVGGNLAQILETIGVTIRERVRIKGEIRSLTASVRYSGYVVGFLPLALGTILFLVKPDYIGALFKDACGWSMVATAAILMVLGFVTIRRIADIQI